MLRCTSSHPQGRSSLFVRFFRSCVYRVVGPALASFRVSPQNHIVCESRVSPSRNSSALASSSQSISSRSCFWSAVRTSSGPTRRIPCGGSPCSRGGHRSGRASWFQCPQHQQKRTETRNCFMPSSSPDRCQPSALSSLRPILPPSESSITCS